MIITNKYFTGEIYISHANPSITDDVVGEEGSINWFIDEYSRLCLIKVLGYQLFLEFEAVIDDTQANGLVAGADTKWDYLLNGHTYIDSSDNNVKWRGIRFKSPSTSEDYNKSFLANYVYFYNEKNFAISRSSVGNVKIQPKNAVIADPTPKAVNAFRKFVDLVQGDCSYNRAYIHNGATVVDWYGSDGGEITLNRFISDQNTLVPDTYADFSPKLWKRPNNYGI